MHAMWKIELTRSGTGFHIRSGHRQRRADLELAFQRLSYFCSFHFHKVHHYFLFINTDGSWTISVKCPIYLYGFSCNQMIN